MHWWLHLRRTCRWPLAYHLRAACSNLFNGKADVPNCDALASVDSPSLIYVRLIECLFCLPFRLFGHCCSQVCKSVSSQSVSLSFWLRRKRSLPCSAAKSPLAPSLPTSVIHCLSSFLQTGASSLAIHISSLQPCFKIAKQRIPKVPSFNQYCKSSLTCLM